MNFQEVTEQAVPTKHYGRIGFASQANSPSCKHSKESSTFQQSLK